ncbi:MAG: hypothetical protein KBD23_00700 [Gammaproteobacteria bacterium]|nr:hypothetical protein [Gammaproteobacteria bacterium]
MKKKRSKPYVEQPRIRTVKPQLFKHEWLYQTEKETQLPIRLGFIGLFGLCDGEGYFKWQPGRMRAEVFPYESVDCEALLEALRGAHFIEKFVFEGESFGRIPSWLKHQLMGDQEPETGFPRLLPSGEVVPGFVELEDFENNDNLCDGLSLKAHRFGREGKGKGRGGKGRKGKGRKVKGSGRERQALVLRDASETTSTECPLEQVFAHWKTVMNRSRARLDRKRRALVQKALKLGYTVQDLCEAISGCSLTPHNQGHNDRGERYDGLELILRTADQIDRFMHNYQHPPRLLNRLEAQQAENIRELQAWVRAKQQEPSYESQ